ncbi:MAG: glycosyl transferase [Gammaproteobacteria bacterium GWF2_41_13]|nr:MAG: glycosyl transferase [Gammaproteobacteria bacterium GWF2_41_13]
MNDTINNLSIVIPVYNAGKTLDHLTARIEKAVSLYVIQYELLFVNDGSQDDSWQKIQELSKKYNFIKGFNLTKNYGQHNALLCGIRQAQYPICVTIDDDLQNPPEEIQKLIKKLNEGYDLVYGVPEKERHGFWRDAASKLTKVILRYFTGLKYARDVGAFRAFRTQLREGFDAFSSHFIMLDVLFSWVTTNIGKVKVNHDERQNGRSGYDFMKLVHHAMNLCFGASIVPLRLAILLGIFTAFFGMLVFLWVMIKFLIFGSVVQGFTFLASIIAVFSGVQLLTLGIMGEYLGRMYFRQMDRVSYVIREMTNGK